MLGMHKQSGPACVAYALWNAGIVNEDAVRAYEQKIEEETSPFSMMQVLTMDEEGNLVPYFGQIGTPFNSVNESYGPGGPHFVRPWLEEFNVPQYVKDGMERFWKEAAEIRPSYIAGFYMGAYEPLPASGRGVVLLVLPGAGSHAMAYEDGKVSDSDNAEPVLETWKEYTARILTYGAPAKPFILTVIKEPQYAEQEAQAA